MDATTWGPALLTAAAMVVHLWAERRGRARLRAVAKILASIGFLLLGALRFAPGRFGALVLTGLALSALGDACLLGRGRAFLAGLGAFLLAHLAYAAAFAPRSHPSGLTAAAAAAIAAVALGVLRWLWPRLGALRPAVVAYTAAISVMLVLALGVPDARVRAGAALFFLSDLLVARDRFVAPGLANHLVGLPLYYAGQLLLAAAIAG